jgi:dTDP-4-dehydrorhamnose reductase
MSPRILITGATGQIGWQLQRALAPLGNVIAFTRSQVDFAQPDSVAEFVRDRAPDIVVNAAAYTAVDRAESEPELAHTVNAVTPGRIAQELAKTGGLLIHYSTY